MEEQKEKKNIRINIKTIVVTIVFVLVFTRINVLLLLVGYYNSRVIPADKPVIYLYPEQETEISVNVGYPEKLTSTYPKYIDGWNVIAKPNGDLVDTKTGRSLYCLYWEGISDADKEIKEGFCVKNEDSAKFLEEKLSILGLNEREANEFIIYWLPILESSKYNLIYFETMEEIEKDMPLEVNPKPETVIRVMMKFKGISERQEIKEQKLETPERKGYTLVEWGGILIH